MKKPVISILGLCGKSVFMKVDHFHKPGETLHAKSLYTEPGGKGFNQAVAAARLGADVHFFAACGADVDGKACEDFLTAEGIIPHIEIVGVPTAFASILTDKEGGNQVTVYRGSADSLSTGFILEHESVFAGSDIILLNFEVPDEANEAALCLAEKYRKKAILNPAPAHPCKPDFLSRFYCITPNQAESEILECEMEREIITLGSEGALLIENGVKSHFPATKVSVKDTTGAGDCFNAALAVLLGEGRTLREAVQFAQKAAAISVSSDFVMPSLPYRNQIE